jgi:hypothetical protein
MTNARTQQAGSAVMLYTPEGFCLLGYNAVHSVESKPTFRRNIWPPSSGSKKKPIVKQRAYNTAYSYSGGVRFESWSGHRLY